MQEFCPSCEKNGVKSRIKAFQLNFEEAAFMCSNDSCIWPVGCQDLTFFSRPLGKDWSKDWDEAAAKHFKKKEPDPLSELSAYTPPQTPGTELVNKETNLTSSAIQGSVTTVPNKVVSTKPVSVDNFQSVDSFEQNDFDDLILNCTFEDLNGLDDDFSGFDDIEDCKILKPKLDISKTVNCKLEKEPAQEPVFIEKCDRTDVFERNRNRQVNCKNILITNKTTSLVCKNEVKDEKPSIPKFSPIKEKSRLGIRTLKRKCNSLNSFEKFNFDDIKLKSKKIKQESCKKEPIQIEICIPNQTETKKLVKLEKNRENSQKIIKIIKMENSSFDFNVDKLKNERSTNVNSIINNVELLNYNEKVTEFSDKDQIDFDNILGLTSSSKDSGVDQDIIANSGVDMDLEELLAGFSDDLTSSISCNSHNYDTQKIRVEETDENKWINSLFE